MPLLSSRAAAFKLTASELPALGLIGALVQFLIGNETSPRDVLVRYESVSTSLVPLQSLLPRIYIPALENYGILPLLNTQKYPSRTTSMRTRTLPRKPLRRWQDPW
jgi:hypothetical protein